jgi:hypothetical protein
MVVLGHKGIDAVLDELKPSFKAAANPPLAAAYGNNLEKHPQWKLL